MKSISIIITLLISGITFSQNLLDIYENERRRQEYIDTKLTLEIYDLIKDSYVQQIPQATLTDVTLGPAALKTKQDEAMDAAEIEAENKSFPLAAFGSDLNAGSDAVGFRPSIVAASQFTIRNIVIQPSIKTTKVDNQNFSVEKTGQALFVSDISNFSANLGMVIGFPYSKTPTATQTKFQNRFGLVTSIHLQGHSLFNLDSTTFISVKNDISSFSLRVGLEAIIIKESFSMYFDLRALSITNNRDNFHDYFPENSKKDFLYTKFGFRFKAVEGIKGFKNIVFDVSTIILDKRMRVLAGTQNTLIPLVKIGYVKKIDWKNSGN